MKTLFARLKGLPPFMLFLFVALFPVPGSAQTWKPGKDEVREIQSDNIVYTAQTRLDQTGHYYITFSPMRMRGYPDYMLVFLRVHEYGHVHFDHLRQRTPIAQQEAQADCWAARELTRTDPDLLNRVVWYMENVMKTGGGDVNHGNGYQMAEMIRRCASGVPRNDQSSGDEAQSNRNSSADTRSEPTEEEMQECLERRQERCIPSCMKNFGYSRATCESVACTFNDLNLSAWRRACKRELRNR